MELVEDIFAQVLRIDRATLIHSSDFFQLGGSSLDTILVISRIESALGIRCEYNCSNAIIAYFSY